MKVQERQVRERQLAEQKAKEQAERQAREEAERKAREEAARRQAEQRRREEQKRAREVEHFLSLANQALDALSPTEAAAYADEVLQRFPGSPDALDIKRRTAELDSRLRADAERRVRDAEAKFEAGQGGRGGDPRVSATTRAHPLVAQALARLNERLSRLEREERQKQEEERRRIQAEARTACRCRRQSR